MRIDSSQKAFACLEKGMSKEVEEFWVIALNSGLEIIDMKLLFRGTANSCLVHPRDLIRFICCQNATSFVIAHNHPSGDVRPSKYDLEITKRLFHLSSVVEIPMKDHIILGSGKFYSFADNGLLMRFAQTKSLRLRT